MYFLNILQIYLAFHWPQFFLLLNFDLFFVLNIMFLFFFLIILLVFFFLIIRQWVLQRFNLFLLIYYKEKDNYLVLVDKFICF